MSGAPALAGIHHLKLPVTDLARSREWYPGRLGYRLQAEFAEQGRLMGCALAHPSGGPRLALRLDPDRARAAAGFNYFSIGVLDKEAIDRLAAWSTELGEEHTGKHSGITAPESPSPSRRANRRSPSSAHSRRYPGLKPARRADFSPGPGSNQGR